MHEDSIQSVRIETSWNITRINIVFCGLLMAADRLGGGCGHI